MGLSLIFHRLFWNHLQLYRRVSVVAWIVFGAGIVVAILSANLLGNAWLGVVFAVLWILSFRPIFRLVLLPHFFPATTCPGCFRTIPLVARWKCGDHYTDHRERNIFNFRCSRGHRLESFNCPRCGATIIVQRGPLKLYRHGMALRLRSRSFPKTKGIRGLVLGKDPQGRQVSIPSERLSWHAAILGGTGRGKSTLLSHLAHQLILEGKGVTILDPGGDMSKDLLAHIPPERESEVIFFDLLNRSHPIPLNILSAKDDVEAALLAEELLGVLQRLHDASWGPLLSHQLRMAFRTVMPQHGNLRDVYELFANPMSRMKYLHQIRDPDVAAFWAQEYPRIAQARRSTVLNKLAPIVLHPVLGPVLAARECVLDADALIAERQIFCASLATGTPGPEATMLLGTFLVHKITAAAFRQAILPTNARVAHVLIVDEFQRFMGEASGFEQILAEARKYRLSLIVANQYVEQLPLSMRSALFGNVGCLVSFRVGHRDSKLLAQEFLDASPEDLLELKRGHCLVRLGNDWTVIHTLPPLLPPTDDPTRRIIAANLKRFSN